MSEVVTSLADPSANVIFGAVIDDQVRAGAGAGAWGSWCCLFGPGAGQGAVVQTRVHVPH